MGMPVKLSDDLVASARKEAASTDRSITGQIEHWAKIGRSVETVLRHQDVQALKGVAAGRSSDAPGATGRPGGVGEVGDRKETEVRSGVPLEGRPGRLSRAILQVQG